MSVEAILPLHIDSTMRSAFSACPEKFRNEFILGLRPAHISIDLHAGGVFSSTLEHFYRSVFEDKIPPNVAQVRAYGHFARAWGQFDPMKDTAKTPENMWHAVESYIATYPPMLDHVQPLQYGGRTAVEFSFAIPLDFPGFPLHPSGMPFIYVGRADLLGQLMSSCRPVIRDEKTAGKLDYNWAQKWDMRGQFLGYCWAAQQGGIPVDTVVVRGIIVTKRDIRHVEAIKIYAQWEIDRWFEQLRRNLIRLRKCWDDGFFDLDFGDACSSYGGCPFIDLCKSPTPEAWYPNFRVSRWNPLLRNPIDDASPAFPLLLQPKETVNV